MWLVGIEMQAIVLFSLQLYTAYSRGMNVEKLKH